MDGSLDTALHMVVGQWIYKLGLNCLVSSQGHLKRIQQTSAVGDVVPWPVVRCSAKWFYNEWTAAANNVVVSQNSVIDSIKPTFSGDSQFWETAMWNPCHNKPHVYIKLAALLRYVFIAGVICCEMDILSSIRTVIDQFSHHRKLCSTIIDYQLFQVLSTMICPY